MFGATPFSNGTTAELAAQMLKFDKAHIIYMTRNFAPLRIPTTDTGTEEEGEREN